MRWESGSSKCSLNRWPPASRFALTASPVLQRPRLHASTFRPRRSPGTNVVALGERAEHRLQMGDKPVADKGRIHRDDGLADIRGPPSMVANIEAS